MTVYIDSGAFIGYLRGKDRDHQAARREFVRLQEQRSRLVTSDAVIGEVATRLRYDIGLDATATFRHFLKALRHRLRIVESSPERRGKAFDLMAQYADLRLSYPDAVGAVVAREVNVKAVFAFDNDFRILGFPVMP